mmetsp:Transcript_25422/g.37845  ORF Transcript_25422/g.37845 Transcript_25422/m.37845 type:complete len:411 (-) Transcript_25422:87-1319(-)
MVSVRRGKKMRNTSNTKKIATFLVSTPITRLLYMGGALAVVHLYISLSYINLKMETAAVEGENAIMDNDGRVILYLHIGKTGGTTLDQVFRSNCEWNELNKPPLRVKNCYSALPKKEIPLSSLISQTVHFTVQHRDGDHAMQSIKTAIQRKNVTSFLFTLRNPIDRAVSAFNMQHIDNTLRWPKRYMSEQHLRINFYHDCFQTIEDLAMVLGRRRGNTTYVDKVTNETRDCYMLGKQAIRGRAGHIFQGGPHLFYNYGRYHYETIHAYPEKEVMVVRTEHLWDDIARLNVALGGNKSDISEEMKRHTATYESEKRPVHSGLSMEGKAILCCYLSGENEIYEDILRRAINLNEDEKRAYLLGGLYADCGTFKEYKPMEEYWAGIRRTNSNGDQIEWEKFQKDEERCSRYNL